MWSLINSELSVIPLDSGWAQVYVDLGLAMLTLLTLVVLCIYAWDTHHIASISMEQFKNSQTPFLALIKKDVRDDRRNETTARFLPPTNSSWFVENQGNSAALNINFQCEYYLRGRENSGSCFLRLNPIAPDGNVRLKEPSCAEDVSTCRIYYESLDGRKFRTIVRLIDGKLESEFAKSDS
jgi:hypothetical protein